MFLLLKCCHKTLLCRFETFIVVFDLIVVFLHCLMMDRKLICTSF